MSPLWKLVNHCARRCLKLNTYRPKPVQSVMAGFISFIPVVHGLDFVGTNKIEIPNQTNLSHEHLIQQAASVSVNAATQLLTQTVVAIADISDCYKKALLDLMSVMEENQSGIINMSSEDQDAIIVLRSKANMFKEQLMALNTLLDYVEKVTISTAEASYLIGADLVSAALTERLYSLKVQLEEKHKEIANLERECLLLHKNLIVETK